MKKRLLAMTLSLVLLSGCAGAPQSGGGVGPNTPPVKASAVAPVESVAPTEIPDTGFGIGGFSLGLLQKSRVEGENTLISPLSAVMALALVSGGAQGETLDQLLAVMGNGCTLEELNASCAAMIDAYAALPGESTLELANSLWLAEGFQGEVGYLNRCTDLYDAQVFDVDFAARETVGKVNAWVKERTHGKIETLLNEIDPATAAILINALYLNAKWASPFQERNTDDAYFYPAQGDAAKTPFMSKLGQTRYFATEGEEGVLLPYRDGRLAFLAVLPGEGTGLTEYLAGWDKDTLGTFLSASQEQTVQLSLPKFKTEWSGDLTDTLKTLGITDAFNPQTSDFTPMGRSAAGEAVYLSKAVQKTFISVDEEGTEAAAVTGAMMAYGGYTVIGEYVTLIFDRPFVCAVVDMETGVPLFLGTYEGT